MGNIINRKGCTDNSELHLFIERTPFPWGGVKIIGWGKTTYKSYPTLRVSIVRIEVRTRRVS